MRTPRPLQQCDSGRCYNLERLAPRVQGSMTVPVRQVSSGSTFALTWLLHKECISDLVPGVVVERDRLSAPCWPEGTILCRMGDEEVRAGA
eukprot:23470-Eustigmatos_ZCMA.PRE.1